MSILIRTWHLANGLKVEILDDTVSYYGDYSTVKLTIRCARSRWKRSISGPSTTIPATG
ncbi:MAG: hypothetical protein ABSC19_10560 [Syntrophorhabdales bacterium]